MRPFFILMGLAFVSSIETPAPTRTKDPIHLNAANPQVPVDVPVPELIQASENGDVDAVQEILLKNVPIDEPNNVGWTALMKASFYGHEEVVRVLLNAGANAGVYGGEQADSSLTLASANGHVDIVKALLLSEGGRGTLNMKDAGGWTPLVWAAQQGHAKVVRLLLSAGALIDGAPDGGSPLAGATAAGHLDVIRILLEAGANPNKPDGKGTTPLSLAKNQTVRAALSVEVEKNEL